MLIEQERGSMNIVVIGAGAMGSIYGGRLSQWNEVTLVDTNEALVEKVSRDGVTLEEGGEERTFHPSAGTDASAAGTADLVILFTKALYSVSALENVRGAIGPDTYLMTLQNGAGHERVLSAFADPSHIIIGTTEDNGAVLSLGHVHHGGEGVTNIGRLDGADDPFLGRVKESFDPCGFDVRIHGNIQQLIWDKLMTNVSLSALTAVLQCDMHYVSQDGHAFSVCVHLIKEAVAVAAAMGLAFDEEKVIAKVRRTSEGNKGGYTSIMMDIRNGRRTEVDTISGAVVAKAHELGVPVPHHEMMVSLIHALEGVNKG